MTVTERVAMSTLGGAWSAATISAMKFAVMPMMEMRQMACMARATVKDAPRAPNCGPDILMGVGEGFFGLGLDIGFGFGSGFGSGFDFGFGVGFGSGFSSGEGDLGRDLGSGSGLGEAGLVGGGKAVGAGGVG
jgi:hypothetical protein